MRKNLKVQFTWLCWLFFLGSNLNAMDPLDGQEQAPLDFQVSNFRATTMTTLPARVVYELMAFFKPQPQLSPDALLKIIPHVRVNGQELNQKEQAMLYTLLQERHAELPSERLHDGGLETGTFGGEFGHLTDQHHQFFAFAAELSAEPKPVLEIGCAYGKSTLAALALGAWVIASDLDAKLLVALVKNTPPEHLDQLEINLGAAPDNLSLEPGSLKGVLISHVIHYLFPEQLKALIDKLWASLAMGGKLFVFAITSNYGAFNDDEVESIRKTALVALAHPEHIGDLQCQDLKLSFPTYIQYVVPGGDHTLRSSHAFIPSPQSKEITEIYLKKAGFFIDCSKSYISSKQIQAWREFEKTNNNAHTRIRNSPGQQVDYNIITVEDRIKGGFTARAIFRLDFRHQCNRFAHGLSPEQVDKLDLIRLNESLAPWPTDDHPLGGNMVIVASKQEQPYILGQLPAQPSCSMCHVMARKEQLNTCARCRQVYYCNKNCQTEHWPTHKKNCHAQK